MALLFPFSLLSAFAYDFGSGNKEPGTHWLPGLALETVIGVVLYHLLFFRVLKPMLNAFFSRRSYWEYLLTYKGMFHPNVQKEIVYVSILGIHHLIGGSMMLYGWYKSDPAWFAQGALFDLYDAIHDTLCICAPFWPFEDRNKLLMSLLIPHHAFSFIICWPAIISGLYMNPNAQLIGGTLLFAGGISCCGLVFSRTCNRTNPSEAIQEAIAWVINCGFYFFCRFYVYPSALYRLMQASWDRMGWQFRVAVVFVNCCMAFFNIAIGLDVIQGTIRSVKCALAGGAKPKDPMSPVSPRNPVERDESFEKHPSSGFAEAVITSPTAMARKLSMRKREGQKKDE